MNNQIRCEAFGPLDAEMLVFMHVQQQRSKPEPQFPTENNLISSGVQTRMKRCQSRNGEREEKKKSGS